MVRAWSTLPMLQVDDYSMVDAQQLQRMADLVAQLARNNRGAPLLAPLTEDFWAETIRAAASSGKAEMRPRWPAEAALTIGGRVPERDFYAVGGARCCARSSPCTCGFNEAGRPCCQESRMAWANGGADWRRKTQAKRLQWRNARTR